MMVVHRYIQLLCVLQNMMKLDLNDDLVLEVATNNFKLFSNEACGVELVAYQFRPPTFLLAAKKAYKTGGKLIIPRALFR